MSDKALRVTLIKPSKYGNDGYVERFRRGFMPNSTLLHLKGLTPAQVGGGPITVEMVDEYTQTNLDYLKRLHPDHCSLLALVGVQSHQMHRALDLAALALNRGVRCCVIGGPHPMTCDVSQVENRGVSFALAEAELIWESILRDAAAGCLRPMYGSEQRWATKLDWNPLATLEPKELKRFIVPMVGVYPARGCPYSCSFCSVIKIAGKAVRSQPISTTLQTLHLAKAAGAKLFMFTSDNFNKYREAKSLLSEMIDTKLCVPFTCQCDVQLHRDPDLISLLSRAGCVQVFLGVESFSKSVLRDSGKRQNNPKHYEDLVEVCHEKGITTHFSNIIGFPEQTQEDVVEHIHEINKVRPYMASFYILTPIPGTEQYDQFLDAGIINEANLDRFDATELVWKHPNFDRTMLCSLLYRAYREFYTAREVIKTTYSRQWNAPNSVRRIGLGYAAFARYSAFRKRHPMAGGLFRCQADSAAEYRQLRRDRFGIDLLELPRNKRIASSSDIELNKKGVPRSA